MKDLIDRVIALNAPADEGTVNKIIEFLGETPSLNDLKAVTDFYKAELRQILTKDLLEWMQEHDQINFDTEDVNVKIRTNVSAKVLDPDNAFSWLENNQYGDLIKDNLEFPKGELTPEAEDALESLGLSFIKKSGIHPQSLKKIMKDRLEAGELLPDENAGIQIGYFDECVVKEK